MHAGVWPGPELVTNWVTLDNVQYATDGEAGQSPGRLGHCRVPWCGDLLGRDGHYRRTRGQALARHYFVFWSSGAPPGCAAPMPGHRPVGVTLAGCSCGSPRTGHWSMDCLVTYVCVLHSLLSFYSQVFILIRILHSFLMVFIHLKYFRFTSFISISFY